MFTHFYNGLCITGGFSAVDIWVQDGGRRDRCQGDQYDEGGRGGSQQSTQGRLLWQQSTQGMLLWQHNTHGRLLWQQITQSRLLWQQSTQGRLLWHQLLIWSVYFKNQYYFWDSYFCGICLGCSQSQNQIKVSGK